MAPGNHELMFWAGLGRVHAGDLDAGVAYVEAAIEVQPNWRELLRRLPADAVPSAAAVLARLLAAPSASAGAWPRASRRARPPAAHASRRGSPRGSDATPSAPGERLDDLLASLLGGLGGVQHLLARRRPCVSRLNDHSPVSSSRAARSRSVSTASRNSCPRRPCSM